MMSTVNVVLNGKNVKANKDETVLELATRHGYYIPTLCHDPRLEPFSACLVCLVHVEKMNGFQPSCSLKVTEGMVIDTESEEVKKARRFSLELLLSNHYADCIGPCKETCPAGVDVQGYISLIEKGMYKEAVGLIKEDNPLPAICGRVCVRPCEVACRRNLLDENSGVGIDYLKRFAADKDLESEDHYRPNVLPDSGKSVAVIGGGPGGLSAAYWLAQSGHKVDIYEAMPHAGGWLRYGIPEYRLPNSVLEKEISTITELGVNIFTNKKLGENISYKELKDKYDAVILTIGSQKGTLVGVEGEDADGVYSGIDFLRNMEATGQRYDFKGKKIVVVGGGNTAMDCCRTSRRCGSEDVSVVYRRTEAEMPANPIEIHESKLEGVKYMFLTSPVKILKGENGKLKSMVCLKMELGEPDASGRRRPIAIEGSEFEIECDYILAAIGQKTDVGFINDINQFAENGELKINKWGDIEANPETLQTGIPSVFAAGDGVTGPATIIAAIAQAKLAVNSCNQYLRGEEVKPVKKEFFSRKENFRKQEKEAYLNKFSRQLREEMPVLNPDNRMNFSEVELGYASEDIAKNETARCLECGCSALYTCDLKKHATDYNASQVHFAGLFNEYSIDFSHPYIEIDNNKCILCGRCVRICKEVVGAEALGFVKRGSKAYIAPAMNMSLKDTKCESCGLCISTCTTGALSENKLFKPGPVRTDTFKMICNYCSVGCELIVHHRGDFVYEISGANGLVNQGGNFCNKGRFGYHYMNDKSRLLSPRLKENGVWKEIDWKQAFDIIAQKVKSVKASENAFFAGARLSNEEQYYIQKIARTGVKTNNISSFHYIERGKGYVGNGSASISFSDLKLAKAIWILDPDLINSNGVAGFAIQNARFNSKIPVTIIAEKNNHAMDHKADRIIFINSKYAFIKAINYYLLDSGKQNSFFIKGRTKGFDEYKNNLLKEDYDSLIKDSGLSKDEIESLANEFDSIAETVIVYTEAETSSNCALEINNLMLISGKHEKTGSGILALKSKNNSHGLHDNGICPKLAPGGRLLKDAKSDLEKLWQVDNLPVDSDFSIKENLANRQVKNIFIFGEDPIGTAFKIEEAKTLLSDNAFIVVADYFMTDTAESASLVLPMAFPFEIGGSYTNTGKIIQNFEAVLEPKTGKNNIEMLSGFAEAIGMSPFSSKEEIFMEFASLLPVDREILFSFDYTNNDNPCNMFAHGADNLVLRHSNHFNDLMNN